LVSTTRQPAQKSSARWKDLRIRALSALVMIPLAIGAILAGGVFWQVVLGALTFGALVEWAMLCGFTRRAWPLILGNGCAYIALAYISLLWLRLQPAGAADMLFVAVTVSAGDIGAYLAGRLIGGPKLAPALSPGKTRSGAAGGLVAGMAAGMAVAGFYGAGPAGLGTAALLAACLGVVAQAGDLLESAVKRWFGKKDSSQLIPGHGGLLDRLDGLLAAAPAAALWLVVRQGAYLWQ
jgi:phosphatidate cytidylyltransferase